MDLIVRLLATRLIIGVKVVEVKRGLDRAHDRFCKTSTTDNTDDTDEDMGSFPLFIRGICVIRG